MKVAANPLAVLTPAERQQLRDVMASPAYQKLLSLAENFKPSAHCANAGSGARDAFGNDRANARLGEIRGWDLHVTALFAALNPPEEIKQALQETWPDEARVDFEPMPSKRKKTA